MRQATGLDWIANDHGFAVIYPEASDGFFPIPCPGCQNDGRDGFEEIDFAREIIRWTSETYAVHPDSVYATGFSMGGFFINYLGCAPNSPVRGIAPVAAGASPEPKPPVEIDAARRAMIVYTSGNSEHPGIVKIRADGSEARQLTSGSQLLPEVSPDGKYLLVEYLVEPWSHEVAWWRFASEIEVWSPEGKMVAKVASLPLANEVPIHGVPLGPRSVGWRPTADHTLFWVEALDGGDPVAEVPHRDRLMRLQAPFIGTPEEVFKAEHRIISWRSGWCADGGTLMLTQRERMRRWRYVWLLDVDADTSRLWFDLDTGDRYGDPGTPVFRSLPNGQWVMRQEGDAVYFRGSGATDQGDRPFLSVPRGGGTLPPPDLGR